MPQIRQTTHYSLSPEAKKLIKRTAKKMGLSMSSLVELSVRRFVACDLMGKKTAAKR